MNVIAYSIKSRPTLESESDLEWQKQSKMYKQKHPLLLN